MGFIYIGKGANDVAFKIGTTSKPEEERLKQHRTASPSFTYHLLIESKAHRKIEKYLHDWFESKRVRGTKEWYLLGLGDIELAKPMAEKYEAEDLPMISKVEDLKIQETSDSFIEAIPSAEQDYLRLKVLREQQFRDAQEIARLENRLKLQIGTNAGIANLFSWKSQTQRVFNSQLFKQERPDTYEEYRQASVRRCFLIL